MSISYGSLGISYLDPSKLPAMLTKTKGTGVDLFLMN